MLNYLPKTARALLVAAFFMAPGSEASAQVELGANGSLTNIQGSSFGIAGRLGVVAKKGSTWDVVVEGVGEAIFPSCAAADCSVVGGQLNFLWQRAYHGLYRGYGGFGVVYQSVTVEQDGGQVFDGTDWGVSLILGNRLVTSSPFEPFIEVRLTSMHKLKDQGSLAAGFRIALGGQ